MTALVVFDCFDTVLREKAAHRDAGESRHSRRKLILNILAEAWKTEDDRPRLQALAGVLRLQIERFPSQSFGRSFMIAAHDVGMKFDSARVARVLEALICQYEPMPGVNDCLTRLAADNHCLRMLSDTYLAGDVMERLLAAHGLLEYFSELYFSSETLLRKPDLSAFRMASAGGPFSRTLMVGDDHELDLQPALVLGWQTVLIDCERPDFSRVVQTLAKAS